MKFHELWCCQAWLKSKLQTACLLSFYQLCYVECWLPWTMNVLIATHLLKNRGLWSVPLHESEPLQAGYESISSMLFDLDYVIDDEWSSSGISTLPNHFDIRFLEKKTMINISIMYRDMKHWHEYQSRWLRLREWIRDVKYPNHLLLVLRTWVWCNSQDCELKVEVQ